MTEKWWERASLEQLDAGVNECDETQSGIINALHRLIREVQELRAERGLGNGPLATDEADEKIDETAEWFRSSLTNQIPPHLRTDKRIGTNRPMP